MIREGDPAPDFALEADDGSTVTRDSLAGKNVVLFFYPKDNTPGCTTEATAATSTTGGAGGASDTGTEA